MVEKKYVEKEVMLEYIDQNIPRMIPNKDGKHPIPIEAVRNFIATFDTSDAVESVRCKDCKWRGSEECAMFYRCDCGEQNTWETDNDYCSYGEKG